MPRRETVVDVLVASPGDLEPERRVTEEVIAEWNRTWSRERAVRLNSLTWEADTFPDFGKDAQDVVNRQLGDDYDIFLGVLWARFGTPTMRAASGTLEEFERALARHRDDPESVKIMIYFKSAAISPESDPEQLKQVQEFRARLKELGALYHTFNSEDDFASYLRIHLSKQVQEWIDPGFARSRKKTPEPRTEGVDASGPPEDANKEEEGFLDLVEAGTENFQELAEHSSRFTAVLGEFGERISANTEELNALKSKPSEDVASRKRIIKKSAKATVGLAEAVEVFIQDFRKTYGAAMDSYGKAAALIVDFDPEDSSLVQDSLETVVELKETLERSLEQMKAFRVSIESTPRVTTEFNKAKKRAVLALSLLETEMEVGINSSKEVESLMSGVIEKIEAGNGTDTESDDLDNGR